MTATTLSAEFLTYSALNTFRHCPRKYKHRYVDGLRPLEKADTLSFGSLIHRALELWYRTPATSTRLETVLCDIDSQCAFQHTDERLHAQWHLARAMFTGYAVQYPTEDFEIVAVELPFRGEIRHPVTGAPHPLFHMEGKSDAIVQRADGLYLLEHKTASQLDGNYLDKLWTDTQIALYAYYLRQNGFPIVGVIYNVLLKSRLQQKAGETEAEFAIRHAELAAKNKSGKSTAKRQLPETDEEFAARLAEWYARPEAFHRELIFLSEDRLALLQEEVWELAQQCHSAASRDTWFLNTANCFAYQRPCEYLPYCQSGFNPNVADNLYEIAPPHEELLVAENEPAVE